MKMKKKTMLLLFVVLTTMSFMPSPPFFPPTGNIRGSRVTLHVAWEDGEGLGTNVPQSLVEVPTVSIDGNILYFYDVFSTTVPVFVVDASNNVVFSATLYSGEDKKVLPTSLSGTYTLYMRVGTIMYYGIINL